MIAFVCFVYGVFAAHKGIAECTYHMYQKGHSLTTVACSDGVNGLMSWGYSNLSPMFPYVTAWNQLHWNSPSCGTCIKITGKLSTVYLTALDQCGHPKDSQNNAHFDIAPDAFNQLFGDQGYQKGTMYAEWQVTDSVNCQGNKKQGKSISEMSETELEEQFSEPTTEISEESIQQIISQISGQETSQKAENTVFVTYHNYKQNTPINSVSCSNGQNGLSTRWNYKDLSEMFPYVASLSNTWWNSPNCGKCIEVIANGKKIYVTIIDGCGDTNGYDAHINLSKETFIYLFGQDGINRGSGDATWQFINENNCKGNYGNNHHFKKIK